MDQEILDFVREFVGSVGLPGTLLVAILVLAWKASPKVFAFLAAVSASLERIAGGLEELRRELEEVRQEVRDLKARLFPTHL